CRRRAGVCWPMGWTRPRRLSKSATKAPASSTVNTAAYSASRQCAIFARCGLRTRRPWSRWAAGKQGRDCAEGAAHDMPNTPMPRSKAHFPLAFALMLPIVTAQTIPYTPQARQRALALLKKMTVEEKVGQLNQSAGKPVGDLAPEKPDELIARGGVGSLLWLTNVHEINRLQHIAVEKTRLHIPILFGFDVIHGYRTAFPVPLAMASSWDPSVEEQAQRFAAEDARAAGIQWAFAPMVDIARDARWGRIVEGAGEDPYLGAAMARAQVRGFQGPTIGPNSVLASVKHFAGYGAAEGGRDYDAAYIPEELMQNVYLRPFHAAALQGAATFMSAYMD